MDKGNAQSNIDSLPNVGKYRFEHVFKVHSNKDDMYFYNILKTVNMPKDLDPNTYYSILPEPNTPLTTMSHTHYGTIHLWWLICIANNIDNPVAFIDSTTVIKIIKPVHIDNIIATIKSSLDT